MPPPKKDSITSVSDMTCDELRKLIREEITSISQSELQKIIKDEEFRKMIRNETKDSIRAEIGDRLDTIEMTLNTMQNIQTTIDGLETAMEFTSRRMDDLEKSALPALAQHVERVATKLALQTLDLDIHSRKWSLTIQGLNGAANEDKDITCRACVKLAKDHLSIADASEFDFAACHRLSNKDNAGVIVRFKDLQQCNHWLQNAKNLKSHKDKINISPDLPPVLRPLKKELLEKRKNLTASEKKGSIIRNLKQWPYVEFKILNGPVIRPSTKPEEIVHSVLGFHPTMKFPEYWLHIRDLYSYL